MPRSKDTPWGDGYPPPSRSRKRAERPDVPVPPTRALLVKKVDKMGGRAPYCVEDHPYKSHQGTTKAQQAKYLAEGRTMSKAADVLVSIAGYPVPMCKAHWENFKKHYIANLTQEPPDPTPSTDPPFNPPAN